MSAPMACGCGRRCGITSRFRLPGSRRSFRRSLDRLGAEKLLTPSEIEQIKKGPKDPGKPVISPNGWMYWNVHLDGLEKTHDIIVEREGVFRECVLAMRMAKILGFQVATNTTVYRETDVEEIEHLFELSGNFGDRRPHNFAWVRLRCRQKGYGQTPRIGPGEFLPDAASDH